MFSGCSAPPDSKEIMLRRRHQEASPSLSKNTEAFLAPCHTWKIFPYYWVSFVATYEFSERFTKIFLKDSRIQKFKD